MTTPHTLDVRPDILTQFHQMAERTHRPETELINEALASYLQAERQYREMLGRRLAAADRGEFAPEEEVEAYFAAHADEA
jgi:predicted transcriptional regulator